MPTLNFKGKTFVHNHHLTVKYHQLVPKKEKSLTNKVSLHDNLIVQGDNLKALKALLPTYAGKVKCIYIDPPYNTGNEGWVYNDKVNSPMMREWLGKEVALDDLTRHDKWLCMMMPRLKLLHELLAEDGVIFISIDDNEQHHLRTLLDEIFGANKFIGQISWFKKRKGSYLSKEFTSLTEYVICYRKSDKLNLFGGTPSSNESQPLVKRTNAIGTLRFPANKVKTKLSDGKYPAGIYGKGSSSVELINDLEISSGEVITEFELKGPFIWCQEFLDNEIKIGSKLVMNTKNFQPRAFRNSDEKTKGFPSFIDGREFSATSDDAYENLIEIFGKEKIFDYSKPYNYIKYLINSILHFDKQAIILDSFSGSGTTAHAVLALNKEDGGNRKFILIEMEDYANEITAERVRRVIKGVPASKNFKEGTGGTFSYFELGGPIEMESILEGDRLPSYKDFAKYLFYTATGEEFDPSQINEKTQYIGTSKAYDIYLFYQPNIDYLKSTRLTLERAKALGPHKGKTRLVFAPAKFIDPHTLTDLRIEFSQLPFEIYKLKS